jgi:hypothetical protein
MVTEWLMTMLHGLQQWFLGLFPTTDPPAWLTSVSSVLIDTINRASGLGAWFPFALLGVAAVFLLGLWAVLWGIKGIRWLWGITPFSGGS